VYAGADDPRGTPLAGVPYDLADWKARSIGGAVQDFVDAVRLGRPAAIDLQDATTMVRLVELAHESAARGGALLMTESEADGA
jgi:hypothetical protein